jgi:hypothetical protein
VGRPAAAASDMQNASLKTTPGKRSTAGFRIWVLGAPPRGSDYVTAFYANGPGNGREASRNHYGQLAAGFVIVHGADDI